MGDRHRAARPDQERHPAERQNEYFIPGDNIMREVIQADICRYLGNDALVRPGNYQGRQGYFIRAYRNLTSEMISDLKEDSRRWASERSHLEQRYGYGQAPSYLSSNIHDERQQLGPTPGPNPMQSQPMQGQPMQSQPMQGQPQQQYGQQYPQQYGVQQGMNPPQYGAQQPMGDNYGQSYIHTSGPPSVTYAPSVSYSTYDSNYQQAPRTTTNPFGEPASTYGTTDDYTSSAAYYGATPGTAPPTASPQYQTGMPQQGYPPRDPVGYSDQRAAAPNRHEPSSRHGEREPQRRRR